MFYVVICDDKPGALPIREATRPAHLDYLTSTGVAVQAGPLLDDAGRMAGSLIVLDVADRAAAEAWVAADPYTAAGLFASVTIRAWKRVIG